MTIAQMRAAMTPREFAAWIEFYKLFPFDDRHRYHRPAALVSVSLGGGKIDDRIAFLSPDPKPEGYSSADMSLMKMLGVRPKPKD